MGIDLDVCHRLILFITKLCRLATTLTPQLLANGLCMIRFVDYVSQRQIFALLNDTVNCLNKS